MSTDNIKKLGRVRVTVSGNLVVETNSSARCDYKMVVEGVFSTGKAKDDEEFGKLLWINGTSVLYGIVRAKMEVITSTIFESGKITLPLINMVEFVKKQNEAYLKQHNDKKQS